MLALRTIRENNPNAMLLKLPERGRDVRLAGDPHPSERIVGIEPLRLGLLVHKGKETLDDECLCCAVGFLRSRRTVRRRRARRRSLPGRKCFPVLFLSFVCLAFACFQGKHSIKTSDRIPGILSDLRRRGLSSVTLVTFVTLVTRFTRVTQSMATPAPRMNCACGA